MPDDELDWQAKFEKLTNTPEFQALEEKVAYENPTSYVPTTENDIVADVVGDRGRLGVNVPIEAFQDMVAAFEHVQNHKCVAAAQYLSMILQMFVMQVFKALEKADKLPPPDSLGHEH